MCGTDSEAWLASVDPEEWEQYRRGLGWGAVIAALLAFPVLGVLLWVH
jgi:hypothetical protein